MHTSKGHREGEGRRSHREGQEPILGGAGEIILSWEGLCRKNRVTKRARAWEGKI